MPCPHMWVLHEGGFAQCATCGDVYGLPKPTPRCQCAQLGKDAPCGWCDGPDRDKSTPLALTQGEIVW